MNAPEMLLLGGLIAAGFTAALVTMSIVVAVLERAGIIEVDRT